MREQMLQALIVAPQSGQLLVASREDVALARFNWGRWIVDCGSRLCTSALMLPPGTPIMRCWDCEFVTEDIIWPEAVGLIENLLLMRPDEKTRNWEPGETVDDLVRENLRHGIIVPPRHIEQGPWQVFRTAAVGNRPARPVHVDPIRSIERAP
jgi:hypothetical protein